MQFLTLLPILLAAISMVLPGVFKADHFPDWVNGLIALALIALFSYLTALTDGQLVGGDFATNWAVTAGIFSALLAGPAQPLDNWLQTHAVLPILKPAPVEKSQPT